MKAIRTACMFFVLMTILTGLLYPLFVTAVSQLTMSHKANGSLLYTDGVAVGSELIAQLTTSDFYFHPRPSAIECNPLFPSGGSNLGPTSALLQSTVQERVRTLGVEVTADLVYASGSGLDPHISIQAALVQVPRIAKARALQDESVTRLIYVFQEGRQLGFLGPDYVNVVLLNRALDEAR